MWLCVWFGFDFGFSFGFGFGLNNNTISNILDVYVLIKIIGINEYINKVYRRCKDQMECRRVTATLNGKPNGNSFMAVSSGRAYLERQNEIINYMA